MKINSEELKRIKLLLDGLKKHRAWISGYEMGSGKSVPFSNELRMLHGVIDDLLVGSEASKKSK